MANTPPSSSRPRILLVPEDGLYLAFRLPRILRCAGYEVDLLCEHGHPLAGSRYLAQVEQVPAATLAARTIAVLTVTDSPWQQVLIAHEALLREIVAATPAEELVNWQPALADPAIREFVLSKRGLITAREKWRLPVPDCRVVDSSTEISACAKTYGWPLIAKTFGDSGGGGTLLLSSSADANAIPAARFPLLAQRFVTGRRGIVDMVCSQGRPLAWLSSWSIRQAHGKFGPSTAREFQAMPHLQSLVEAVARHSRWEGFCGFDWIEDAETGDFHFIEFHPRPSSGFRFGQAVGVDFSSAAQAWATGESAHFASLTQPPGPAIEAYYFTGDLLRCLRERDWAGLTHWLPRLRHIHDIYMDDLPLLWSWLCTRLRERFQR